MSNDPSSSTFNLSSVPGHLARYEIVRELGRGGMAVVYLALDPAVKRQVAIKVLPHQLIFNAQFRDRFHREAESVAGLEHPAVTPIYDYGEADGQPYIVMRYMPGGSLADRMARGPVSLQAISKIFNRLSGALDAAHQHGMVHRDLKPSNILFDQWDEAYLSDFGLVKLSESGVTFTGSLVLGTPAYMSPEQANGQGIDGRSDTYSLAVVLFELLTRQLPYKADTPMGMAVAHITQPVPDIRLVDPALPPASNTIIQKALAKSPDDRYPTAGALAAAVSQLASMSFARPPAPPAARSPRSNEDRRAGRALEVPVAVPESQARRRPQGGSGNGLSLPARLGLSIGGGLVAFVVVTVLCLGTVLAAGAVWPFPSPTPAEAQGFVVPETATATATNTLTPTPSPTATATATATGTATLLPSATPTHTRPPPTSTVTPLPTDTPLPSCIPPEFFDPFLNRCRMPDSPQADSPGDGGGSTGGSGGSGGSGGGGGGFPGPIIPIIRTPICCLIFPTP